MIVHPTITFEIAAFLDGHPFERKRTIYLQDTLNFAVYERLSNDVLLVVRDNGIRRFKIDSYGFTYLFEGEKDFLASRDEFWLRFHSNLPLSIQRKVRA